MQLTLKWKNHNTLATTTTIYRSTSPIDKNSLPAAHATVNAANEQYVDTVEYGKKYHYMMQNTNAKGTAFTDNKEVWALPQTGPGPQKLVSGDMNLGFFGFVSARDFITSQGMKDKFPEVLTGPALDIGWLKFARKGKILFVPNGPLTNNMVSLETLYNNGLVFGTDDNGFHQYGATPRNQRRTINVKGREFIVRCMRMNDSADFTWDGQNTNLASGEWYDLILRTINYIPDYQVGDNLGHLETTSGTTPGEYQIKLARTVFQEKMATAAQPVATSSATELGMTTYAALAAYSNATSVQYIPVLELVNDLFI